MKWMLVVLVMGTAPVKTELVFDTLDDCLTAEEEMRRNYVRAFNAWEQWARNNPTQATHPDVRRDAMRRIGLENAATCMPHSSNR